MSPHDIIRAYIFTNNNKNFFCIIDYFQKSPIIKWAENLSADSPITCCNTVLTEYGLPRKILLDVGTNLISGIFRNFCENLNIESGIAIIVLPPKQCPSRSMHEKCKVHNEKNVWRLIWT